MLKSTKPSHIKVFGIDLKGTSSFGTPQSNRKATVAHLVHNRHIIPELIVMNRASVYGRTKSNLATNTTLSQGILTGHYQCHIDEFASAPSFNALRIVAESAPSTTSSPSPTSSAPSSEQSGADKYQSVGQGQRQQTPSGAAVKGRRRGGRGRGVGNASGNTVGGQRQQVSPTSPASSAIANAAAVSAHSSNTSNTNDGTNSTITIPPQSCRPLTAVPSLSDPGALSQSLSSNNNGNDINSPTSPPPSITQTVTKRDASLSTVTTTTTTITLSNEPPLTPVIAKEILNVVQSAATTERGWLYGGGSDASSAASASGANASSVRGFAGAGSSAVAFHCLTRSTLDDFVIREVDKEGHIVGRDYWSSDVLACRALDQSNGNDAESWIDVAGGGEAKNPSPTADASSDSSVSQPSSPQPRPDAKVPEHIETILSAATRHIHVWAVNSGEGGAEAMRKRREAFEKEGAAAAAMRTETGGDKKSRRRDGTTNRYQDGGSGAKNRGAGLAGELADAATAPRAVHSFDIKLPPKLVALLAPTRQHEILLCAALAAVIEGRGSFVTVKEPHPLAALEPRVQESFPMNTVDTFIRSLAVTVGLRPSSSSSSSASSSSNSSRSSPQQPQPQQHFLLRVEVSHDEHLRHLFDLIGEASIVDLRLLRAHVAMEDYFNKLGEYCSLKEEMARTSADSTAAAQTSATMPHTPPLSAAAAAITATAPPSVVSLAIAWPQERLVRIGSHINMVMRYRRNPALRGNEADLARRGILNTSTAPMKKRALRALAAWWMGFERLQREERNNNSNNIDDGPRNCNNKKKETDDGTDEATTFSPVPNLPSEAESLASLTAKRQQQQQRQRSASSPSSSSSPLPQSLLYFGSYRRLRLCGDRDFLFVNVCRERAMTDAEDSGSVGEGRAMVEDRNQHSSSSSSSSTAVVPSPPKRHHLRNAKPFVLPLTAHQVVTSALIRSLEALLLAMGGGDSLSSPSSSSSLLPPPPAAACSTAMAQQQLAALFSTCEVVECVLEKRGLSHEYVVEELLGDLELRREERIVKVLTAIALEALLGAQREAKKALRSSLPSPLDSADPDGSAAIGGETTTVESTSTTTTTTTVGITFANMAGETLALLADAIARTFYEHQIKGVGGGGGGGFRFSGGGILPKISISVTAVVEASSHAFQRLRIRGALLSDVVAFAKTLTSHRKELACGGGADGEDDENYQNSLISSSSGGIVSASSASTSEEASLTQLTSVAGRFVLEEKRRAELKAQKAKEAAAAAAAVDGLNSVLPPPASVSPLLALSSVHTHSLPTMTIPSSAKMTSAPKVIGGVAPKRDFLSPLDSSSAPIADSSLSKTSHSAVVSCGGDATRTEMEKGRIAPLPALLADRVESSSFLLKSFLSADGSIVAGRLTPFGDDASMEGKRINSITSMGRFKKNIFGKSFMAKNADTMGAASDAEAAAFWREHYYVLHNVGVANRTAAMLPRTTRLSSVGAEGSSSKPLRLPASSLSDPSSSASSSVSVVANSFLVPPPPTRDQNATLMRLQSVIRTLHINASKGVHTTTRQPPPSSTTTTTSVTSSDSLLAPHHQPSQKTSSAPSAAAAAAAASSSLYNGPGDLRIGGHSGYDYSVTLRNILPSQMPIVTFAMRRVAGVTRIDRTTASEVLDAMDAKERGERKERHGLRLLQSSSSASRRSPDKAGLEEGSADSSAPQHIDLHQRQRLLANATGFLNYFALSRFSWYTKENMHPGLHLLKGEFRMALTILVPSAGDGGTDDFILDGVAISGKGAVGKENRIDGGDGISAVRGGLDPRSRRLRELQKGESKVTRLLRKAIDDAGGMALVTGGVGREDSCKDLFLRSVGGQVCHLYVNEFLSFVWNEVLSQRIKRYGRRTILAGDLVRPRDPLTGNPINTNATNGGSGGSSKPIYATADDILNGRYTFKDVVMPIPGAGVLLPRHDGLLSIYINTLKRYDIVLNPETNQWDVFGASQSASSPKGSTAKGASALPSSSSKASLVTMASPQSQNPLGLVIKGGYRYAYEVPRAFRCAVTVDEAFEEHLKNLLAVRRNIRAAVKKKNSSHSPTARNLATSHLKSLRLSPHRLRRLTVLFDAQLNSIPLKATLKFQLPASAYSSMLLRELTRLPRTDMRDVMALRKHWSKRDAASEGELVASNTNGLLSRDDEHLKKRWLKKSGRRSTQLGRALMLATLRKQILRAGGTRGKLMQSHRSMPSYGLAVD